MSCLFRPMRAWPGDISLPEKRPCSTSPRCAFSSYMATKLESPGVWRTSTLWAACAAASSSLPRWVEPRAQAKLWSVGGPASWTGPCDGGWRRARWRSSAWRRSRCWRCGWRRRCLPPGRASWRSGPASRVWTSIRPCSNTWPSSRSGLDMDPHCLMLRYIIDIFKTYFMDWMTRK